MKAGLRTGVAAIAERSRLLPPNSTRSESPSPYILEVGEKISRSDPVGSRALFRRSPAHHSANEGM